MPVENIREELHKLIDAVDDKKAEAIYTLLLNGVDIDEKRKKLIQDERSAYLKGEGKSYSWEDVKEMALHKEKRHVL